MLKRVSKYFAQGTLRPFNLRRISAFGYERTTALSLELRHAESCRVLPNRRELLRRLPTGGVVAELGVAEGDFSADILSLNRPQQLHLVDTWNGSRYRLGYERVQARFLNEIAQGRVVLHRKLSTVALECLPDGSFDWVYIDTDHSYENTLAELSLSSHKVKEDGRIAGHDFSRGNPASGLRYGVIEACHQFCSERNWQLEFITVEFDAMFSFCLRRL